MYGHDPRQVRSGAAARRLVKGVTLAVYSPSCESSSTVSAELIFDQLAALVVAMVRNQA